MGSRFVATTAFNIPFSLGRSCSIVSRQLPPRSAVKQRGQRSETTETTGIANCVLAIMDDTWVIGCDSPKRDRAPAVRNSTPSA
jgi:hypothetical protein